MADGNVRSLTKVLEIQHKIIAINTVLECSNFVQKSFNFLLILQLLWLFQVTLQGVAVILSDPLTSIHTHSFIYVVWCVCFRVGASTQRPIRTFLRWRPDLSVESRARPVVIRPLFHDCLRLRHEAQCKKAFSALVLVLLFESDKR